MREKRREGGTLKGRNEVNLFGASRFRRSDVELFVIARKLVLDEP